MPFSSVWWNSIDFLPKRKITECRESRGYKHLSEAEYPEKPTQRKTTTSYNSNEVQLNPPGSQVFWYRGDLHS
ncbi:hypothetical protein EYC84_000948 [Monilinia fructicola]|uniref:Uncharacterized protein n=1 Tax=Monilinia fructicola TaxID=38448 RepID=A0A5M9JMS8_MONFR|nr:hypothetical protein EYC84_000948 [Monilinia fructicola]